MKRTLADLQRDAKEREEDELLRAQLVREQANDAAAKKKMAQEEKYCKKWKDVLEKWDDEELKIASELDLTLPESHRLGPSPFGCTSNFCDLLLIPRCKIEIFLII